MAGKAALKQNINYAVVPLNNVQEENEAVETDLEEAMDDLGDDRDCGEHTYLVLNICMGRFDELVGLAKLGLRVRAGDRLNLEQAYQSRSI